MSGIAPKLPLQLNPQDGIALTKTLKETIKQNLKMLVLTAPGERLMIPNYGVGLRNFLFEQNISAVRTDLGNAIRDQVALFMPFITIVDLEFGSSVVNPQILNTTLKYTIPNATTVQSLNIETETSSTY
jgi:phage baseplate assembly protein W